MNSDAKKAMAVAIEEAKSYTDQKISEQPTPYKIKPAVPTYSDLPQTGNESGDVRETVDTGIEYYWDGTGWKEFGQSVDDELSTTSEHPVQNKVITVELNKRVEKEEGKGLSDNNYSDDEKSKVDSAVQPEELIPLALKSQSGKRIDLEINSSTYELVAKLYDVNDNLISTSTTIDLPIEQLVISVTFDSSTNELVITLKNGNVTRVPLSAIISGLATENWVTSNFVAKVEGKGLSANDYTDDDKDKLDGIEEGAEKNAANTVVDEDYVHTDNNYSDEEKEKLAGLENYDDTEVKEDIESLGTAQTKLEEIVRDRELKIWAYKGLDLSRHFTAAQLHAKIAAEDFSGLEIGDYFPITLNGSYDDYGSYFVPSGTTYYSDAACTTEVGQYTSNKEAYWQDDNTAIVDTNQYVKMEDVTYPYTKTLNNAVVKMEIAAANIYKNHGDTAIPAHLCMVSRDLLPNTIRMRIANSKWHDFDTTKNPWRGSAAYETLNGPNGIIKLVEATELGQYIYGGPNGKGMRFLGDTWTSEAATSPSSWAWMDRGKLFLPTESEVYGRQVWQTSGYACGNLYNQYPLFAGSAKHIIKGAGDGGGRAYWWLASAHSSPAFALVDSYGNADNAGARYLLRVPLCFLLA